MENFQLYKTNPLLGGQLKWDIIIDSSNTKLFVSDFHLSPISNNISYTYKSDENLLNNSHQDNVKKYYNEIKGSFYSEALDSEFNHNFPIISKPNEICTCYSNIYDMGCKRCKFYNKYNKQFEFLCPVWIEKLQDNIEFKISIKSVDSKTKLAENVLKLSKNDIEYHNRFVDYFKNYVNEAGLNIGSDDVINIDFKNRKASLTGLDLSSGLFTTKNIDQLTNNLTLRERPLIESDNMIITSFSDKSMIVKQLFNFNLCFNVNDIITGSLVSLMYGREIVVSVDVFIDGKSLEKKDFYTNYDFISKSVIYNTKRNISVDNFNVLDYLHDNTVIDFVNKNKFCQKICHWSLCDNNDYIFNVYNGFSGIMIETINDGNGKYNTIYHENDHQYGHAPNVLLSKADKSQNSTGWINVIDIDYWNDFYEYISNTDKMKLNGIYVGDNNYINNIKYSVLPENKFYLIGHLVSNNLLYNILDSLDKFDLNFYIELEENLYLLSKKDLYIFVTSDENLLTYRNISNILSNCKSDESIINDLKLLISNKIDPEFITIASSLKWNITDGPAKNIKEVEYYKDNNTQEYVVRYDGKIKPTFIDENSDYKNIIYIKDYLSDDRSNGKSVLQTSKYIKYINTGFEPIYPSINYCSIIPYKNWNYKDILKVNTSEFADVNNKVKVIKSLEYPWFNSGISIILPESIEFNYTNKNNSNSVNDIITNYFIKYFNISDLELITYIKSLYNIKYDWEYYSLTNITDYIYTVKLTLK